ncbi:hypothetical protein AURDEDRAFT_171787 [Auricularia subglabra TFB-10046 SS5]|nr:hypothetical protein AURDEDRAFT_171787 [Auricularia subglabra TFB-10046 SS5]
MSASTYSGAEKIMFAVDCGTTTTAVAFAHLAPGTIPKVHLVNRWPFQEDVAADCKVPTVVRYDGDGKAVAFGAAAMEIDEDQEDTELAYWFKLWLHPADMCRQSNIEPPPLPAGVTINRVYEDFLRFAFGHARDYFKTYYTDGARLWERLQSSFDLVFAIPNGWGSTQQSIIRDAVAAAGILPRNYALRRLAFVSEAEASVHFALDHMSLGNRLGTGTLLTVIDAGGSTVDTTVYRCTDVSPKLQLKEVTSSDVYIDIGFDHLLLDVLEGSRFGMDEYYLKEMSKTFESRAVEEDHIIIQFGPPSCNDRAHGIRMGRLTIPADQIRAAFDPVVTVITESVSGALRRAQSPCETIMLVGGFSESPYLRTALQRQLGRQGTSLVSSDEPNKKAAAEGACLWHIRQLVSARAARYTYGIETSRIFDPKNPVHLERRDKAFKDVAGNTRISGFLSVLVVKNDVVGSDKSAMQSYYQQMQDIPIDLDEFAVQLLASDRQDPGAWAIKRDGSLCDGPRRNRSTGHVYYQLKFDIEMYFGGTELQANIAWTEKGATKRVSFMIQGGDERN